MFGQVEVILALEKPACVFHLSLCSDLSLPEFCERFRDALSLPTFEFDSENETAWGSVVRDFVEYNVSKPYEAGTLQEWDNSVPAGCNFGISISFDYAYPYSNDVNWMFDYLVMPVSQKLADELNSKVFFHRIWLPTGNTAKSVTFIPS